MTKKPKLLYVVNDPAFFLSHRKPLACAAAAAGFEVHVATPEGDGSDRIRKEGFSFHPIHLSPHGLNPLSESATLLGLYSLFRRIRPDLVHLVTIKPVLYGGLVARLVKVPGVVSAIPGMGYVFLARGAFRKLFRQLVCFVYRLALRHPNSRVIFQNRDDRDYFLQHLLATEKQAVLIRGSGVDTEQFCFADDAGGKSPIILFAGRLLWDKGIAEFVEAARLLLASGVRARFVLVGSICDGNRSAVPESEVLEWQRLGIVEWWGFRDDMPSIVLNSTIVCLPSYREGVPKILLEAASCGRAIVATDVPGCKEIVQHGENGLLVPPRDAAALARAINTLLSDSAMRKRLGKNGRYRVESEFSLQHVVGQTMAVYQKLLSCREDKGINNQCI